jgi:hypothetical protein
MNPSPDVVTDRRALEDFVVNNPDLAERRHGYGWRWARRLMSRLRLVSLA